MPKKISFSYFLQNSCGDFIRRLFYILTFLFFSLQLYSQDLLTGFGWGLTNFQYNIIESTGFSELSYNADSQYRYSFLLKYQVPTGKFRVKSGYNYSSIKGTGTISTTEPDENKVPLNVRTENELRTLILGFEYVVKDSIFTPYLGMDLLVAIFGDADVYYKNKSGETIREIFQGKTRIGLSINGGVAYTLIPGIEIDLNLLYGSLNLLGKEDYENNITTVDMTVSVLFVL